MVLAEVGDADGARTPPASCSWSAPLEEDAQKPLTDHLFRARRQGVARKAAVGGRGPAWAVPGMLEGEPSDRGGARTARPWAPRPSGSWPAGGRRRIDDGGGRVPPVSLHPMRGDPPGNAAWGGAASALQPGGDLHGAGAVGLDGDASGGGAAAGVRLARAGAGVDGVVDAATVGAGVARCCGPYVARGGRTDGAGRRRSRAAS
jgi:hypothetical protein